MISLGWGSWKVRLTSAWPLFRDLRLKLAGLPCLQKLVTGVGWCWAKHWAVGVHCAGAIVKIGEGPSPTPLSHLGQSLQPLKKFCQAIKLGRMDIDNARLSS